MNLKANKNSFSLCRIYIIGGIGSGKSCVCEILHKEYGLPVVDLDKIGHKVLEDTEIKHRIKSVFGEGVFINGNVDRKRLAKRAFLSIVNREKLEEITHSKIAKKAEETAKKFIDKMKCSAVIFEVSAFRPEKFKKYYYREGDFIILVTADYDIRVERLKSSRGLNEGQIKNIFVQQLPDKELKTFADIVIENNLDRNFLIKQICEKIPKALSNLCLPAISSKVCNCRINSEVLLNRDALINRRISNA